MHVDEQKGFPRYHVYPKCMAALLCGAAIRMKASTSLQVSDVQGITHSTASVGSCEQTSVLNLIFQQASVAGVGILSK